jgi:hypothetical protein
VSRNKAAPSAGLVSKQIPVGELPVRSSPFEYFTDFKLACTSLKPGHAVELDAARIDEHRARKYLQTLAKIDSGFKPLVLRTATNHEGGRRRVWIVRPVDANGDRIPAEPEAASK